jgi:hypoxanthine phosphoribosyltransferase
MARKYAHNDEEAAKPMSTSIYQQQVHIQHSIDLDFWRKPEGVVVPDDELRFLLVPDAVEAAMVNDIARQVVKYQLQAANEAEQITRALIVTMGGMLPGVLLHDHLAQIRKNKRGIQFGAIGVSLYSGPGEMLEEPVIQQEVSIPVEGECVLLIDDLIDRGGTMRFLTDHLSDLGASKVLKLVLYAKPEALSSVGVDFFFGELPQDIWLITPRELVETLVKRVPVWRQRGASEKECRRRLVELIGYPEYLADQYLPSAYAQAEISTS